MAKKQTKKAEVEVSQAEETVVIEQPVVKTPKVEVKPKPKKDTWEIKDRVYFLKKHKKSLTYSMKSSGIYYFDEEKGYERELKYCENQRTVFVDEMQGDQRLAHIIFRNGGLHVPREKVTLQKLLSLYHPMRDKLFYEHKPQVLASNELDKLEVEADAMIVAKSLDIDKLEAVMRVELGSKVSQMSSKELKRDALLFAKNNPALFLELVEDENVELRNIGVKAVEAGVLRLSQDQRTFFWASNDRKIMTVPFDEHPYSALAVWFKTDEGMEIFKSIEKRLNM